MPPHSTYVEACMGSAEVFLRKKPVEKEIINDYNGDLVRFFRVLQRDAIGNANNAAWEKSCASLLFLDTMVEKGESKHYNTHRTVQLMGIYRGIKDDHSRNLLCLDAYDNERWESVKGSLNRVFLDNGLPNAILCDNGAPRSDNHGVYTPFELWMMQMDVLPIHGRPLHPQTQGKEERFHRTLNEDFLKRTPIHDLAHAQQLFDSYRIEFNTERPHGALGLDVPAKHYRKSPRKMPEVLKEPEYDVGKTLRKVNCNGYISIQNHRYYLSETFIGRYMELLPQDENTIAVCYGNFVIAKVDLDERLFVSRRFSRR